MGIHGNATCVMNFDAATGTSSADLDFASVQRENPEMERRCQEVIDRCWQLGGKNPIERLFDLAHAPCKC